jgi:predicted GNAT family acetyltransferase
MVDATPGVRDDRSRGRFVVEEDGLEAELRYRRRGERLILIHTEVPQELGGRGLGARLVRAATATAAAENLTVVPWCPYARRWLTEHPGEAEGVSIDWQTLPPGAAPDA